MGNKSSKGHRKDSPGRQKCRPERLIFYPKCGINGTILDEGITAQRSESTFDNGIFVTKRALRSDELFEIQLDKICRSWDGSIMIGVASITDEEMELPKTILSMQQDTWFMAGTSIFQGDKETMRNYSYNLDTVWEGDRVGVCRKSNGKLKFYINGEDQGTAATKVPEDVYAVLDLFGRAVKASITENKAPYEESRISRLRKSVSSISPFLMFRRSQSEVGRMENTAKAHEKRKLMKNAALAEKNIDRLTDQKSMPPANPTNKSDIDRRKSAEDYAYRRKPIPKRVNTWTYTQTPFKENDESAEREPTTEVSTGVEDDSHAATSDQEFTAPAEEMEERESFSQDSDGQGFAKEHVEVNSEVCKRSSMKAVARLNYIDDSFDYSRIRKCPLGMYQQLKHKSYDMTGPVKGRALIINVGSGRPGSEVDKLAMESLFEDLGYDVQNLKDPCRNVMDKELESFVTDEKNMSTKSVFVVLMAHGGRDSRQNLYVKLADESRYFFQSAFMDIFSNENAPYLIDKPKVFIIQSCMGGLIDKGTLEKNFGKPLPRRQSDYSKKEFSSGRLLPTNSDCLFAFATMPEHQAARDRFDGSIFLNTINEVFREEAHLSHVCDMLTEVRATIVKATTVEALKQRNRKMEKDKTVDYDLPSEGEEEDGDEDEMTFVQTTHNVDFLTKRFYIFPGI